MYILKDYRSRYEEQLSTNDNTSSAQDFQFTTGNIKTSRSIDKVCALDIMHIKYTHLLGRNTNQCTLQTNNYNNSLRTANTREQSTLFPKKI